MNRPKKRGLDKAIKKLARLTSRGARNRTLSRLSSRIEKLDTDHYKRLQAWRALQVAA